MSTKMGVTRFSSFQHGPPPHGAKREHEKLAGARYPSFAHGPAPGTTREHEATSTPMVAKQYSTRAPHSFQVTSTKPTPRSARNANVPTPARAALMEPNLMRMVSAPSFKPNDMGGKMGTETVAAADRLDSFLLPGDVICLQGRNGGTMMQLGSSGGYMGHVLLVTGAPQPIAKNTPKALQYQHVWPTDHNVATTLWQVSTIESTRSVEGYHESIHIMFIDELSGRVLALGEDQFNKFLKFDQPERVDIWQCPQQLRRGFNFAIMNTVLNEMRSNQGTWSWATAIRAYLFPATVSDNYDKARTLEDIQQCWTAEPICSSLVVVFWQRYICALADMHNASTSPNAMKVDALDWILKWMPLKSDRALPGELLSTMQQCGWVSVSRVPKTGRPRLNTN